MALYRQAGWEDTLPLALCNWASVTLRQGEYVRARTLAEEGLASVVAVQEEARWAARLWAAAAALREAIGAPLPPIERASYEQAVTMVRAQLGEQAYAAAWAQGRTMTPEQVLTLAGQPATPTAKPSPTSPAD